MVLSIIPQAHAKIMSWQCSIEYSYNSKIGRSKWTGENKVEQKHFPVSKFGVRNIQYVPFWHGSRLNCQPIETGETRMQASYLYDGTDYIWWLLMRTVHENHTHSFFALRSVSFSKKLGRTAISAYLGSNQISMYHAAYYIFTWWNSLGTCNFQSKPLFD